MHMLRRMFFPTTAMWLYWQGVALIVVVFTLAKLMAHAAGGLDRLPFGLVDGLADAAALAVIVASVGALTWHRCTRLQRTLAAAAAQRRDADVLAAENDAAIRVARAVAREFAQPLSGALGYSELLMMRADALASGERHELEGMREGVLQLERLLQALNQAAHAPASCVAGRRVADDLESCVAAPRPRLRVRGAVAAVRSDDPSGPAF